MADSFFDGRNQFDDQVRIMPQWMCEQLIEASARRIIRLDGHITAATRLQRLADICAAAHVLPIEHWRELPTATVEPAPPPAEAKKPRYSVWSFWLGFAIGFIGRGIGSV